MAFPFPKTQKLSNIEDKVSGTKKKLELSDRKLSFVNSKVDAFCFYPMNEARLDISDCTFGQLNALMKSEAVVRNSTCDGSGGYILVANKTKVEMVNCTLTCPVVATDEGEADIHRPRLILQP